MGAWGSGSFENDDALDWVAEFSDAPSMQMIQDALNMVADIQVEYLELPECGTAIAAAEVVAALKGAPNPGLPEDICEWLKTETHQTDAELIALSEKAIERIKTDSEMKELWAESDAIRDWYAAINDLQDRLKTGTV